MPVKDDNREPVITYGSEPEDEVERPRGSIHIWDRPVKREHKNVYCKVVIDRDNLTLDYNTREQVARSLREIADMIENRVPLRELEPASPKGSKAWVRDTNGDRCGWFHYEESL